MKLSRGKFLASSAAAAGGVALAGCAEVTRRFTAPALPSRLGRDAVGPDDPSWRVLNRVAYGPRPGDLERVREIGVDAYIEEQLHPERIEEAPAAWARLLPLDTLDMDASDAQEMETAVYPEVGKGPAALELQQACVLRAVYSARQLEQVMVEFWTDHFNVSQLKGECSWLKTVDDRLLRKHALGRFRDLLAASAHSPAMMFYLDNDKNQKRDPKTGSGPNENYARELLELHSLGVRGGYTLKDIQEVARCLSGWSYKKGFQFWPGDFVFNRGQHDDGVKHVLGHTIPAGQGQKDGEQVLDIVAAHPSTARFIARKLCRRFVADRGPERLVARLAEVFTKTGGDIRQTLSELLHSAELRHGKSPKLKRPFDYAVSALRAVNADTNGAGVVPYLEKMGQVPYYWAMPDGYPDRVEAWTSGLLPRWSFALDLVQGKVAGTSVNTAALVKATEGSEPAAVCRSLGRALLGRNLAESEVERLTAAGRGAENVAGSATRWLALLLSSPDFQWR
jgi:uncharacterized protein (DUF1800 family)